ncbi:sigma-70 family RNA polymerase sigma factor [Actinomadura terrae]|uniref:sigma-70 family RNA polymerase sigma factor n=1 Tax=Actinomadura terrae TaxID=604353 RepID=UPI001FA7FD25|nr:sigma-70 family RNA polymerase sigma factor [Actinomadura terrae]
MTGRQDPSEGSPKARGLSPIKQTKTKASIAFAAHLRELRERCGMTSKQAAAALGVDESTLSRYMGGDRLPEWQFLTKFHDLCEEQAGERLPERVRETSRDLMYAAARSRGGLQGRKLELEIAVEAMERQEEHTQQLVNGLQEELDLERSHRKNVEEQFDHLREQAHQDADAAARQLQELTQERDEALDRIAVLEAALSETTMLLELQRGDREMLSHRAQATETKIQEIDNRESSRRTLPPDKDPSKVQCPLCNAYTSVNMRWCVRCLGELSTSAPVGTPSPLDPPEPPFYDPRLNDSYGPTPPGYGFTHGYAGSDGYPDLSYGDLAPPYGKYEPSYGGPEPTPPYGFSDPLGLPLSDPFSPPKSASVAGNSPFSLPTVDELLRRIQEDRHRFEAAQNQAAPPAQSGEQDISSPPEPPSSSDVSAGHVPADRPPVIRSSVHWLEIDREVDRRLAASMAAGGSGALMEVVDHYAYRLYDYSHALLRDEEEAADALHAALIAAYSHIRVFGGQDRFRSWLYALVRNDCLRRLRASERPAERHEAQEVQTVPMNAEERAHRQETRRLVRAAMSGLRGRDRETLDLMLRHGLAASEIGGVLRLSASQATTLADQAFRGLGDALTSVYLAWPYRDTTETTALEEACPAVTASLLGQKQPINSAVQHELLQHIPTCAMCTGRRPQVDATSLFQTLPVALMPGDLRGRILATATEPAMSEELEALARRAEPFDDRGWPVPATVPVEHVAQPKKRLTDRLKWRGSTNASDSASDD